MRSVWILAAHAELAVVVDRGISMKVKAESFTPELRVASFDLAETLALSEAILGYTEANQILMKDQQAIQLLREANELQKKIHSGGSSGQDLDDDIARLRELQGLVSANTAIQEQAIARETAVAFLREVNLEISKLLGVDFAALARRSGTSC
jgi:cell fate (sporulation/competence/biofilm development) regulator YlbF (YheA/YmcA/DUF963 family)